MLPLKIDDPSQSESYQSALDFLFSRINYEHALRIPYRANELKLDRMRRLLRLVGNPEKQLRIIHIAGTKGKGSTAAMISSILSAAGYRTGLYCSPHLERIEERIAIDSAPCTADELISLVSRIRPIVSQMDLETCPRCSCGPTYYDITTALALMHFVERQVDFAILEVGLGGRLDSTNVCQPIVSVITSISYDHTQQLGSTLASISREKAGIIKPGARSSVGVLHPEPAEVISQIAIQRNCRLIRLDHEFHYTREPSRFVAGRRSNGSFEYREDGPQTEPLYGGLWVGMLGEHQAANAAVAVAAIRELQRAGTAVGESAIREGLARAWLPARVEVMAHDPVVIIDSAHNVASMDALLATIYESFPPGPRRCVFAGTRDKDIRGMLARLEGKFDELVLTQYRSNPRAIPVAELAAIAAEVVPQMPAPRWPIPSPLGTIFVPPPLWAS